MPNDAPSDRDGRHRLLERTAHALDVPISTFYGSDPDDDRNAFRLLRLWLAVTSDQGRQRIMSAALREARQCGYREGE